MASRTSPVLLLVGLLMLALLSRSSPVASKASQIVAVPTAPPSTELSDASNEIVVNFPELTEADSEADTDAEADAEALGSTTRVRRNAAWRTPAGTPHRRSSVDRTELASMHAASEQQLELLARAIEEYKRRRLANKGNLRY